MICADFTGGVISSDLGALLLSSVDRRIGLISRLTTTITDFRHPGYIIHNLRDLLTQAYFKSHRVMRTAMIPIRYIVPPVQVCSGTRVSGYR